MWTPGTPVVTAQDEADWCEWKHQRKNQLQRERRASMVRIDYYPSNDSVKVINSLRVPHAGGDASAILDRIISEWLAAKSPTSGIK